MGSPGQVSAPLNLSPCVMASPSDHEWPGKSVMCSYVVGVLSQKSDLNTCYYFCNSQDTANVSDQILRTIALQLLRRHPDLASLICNEFVYRGPLCGMSQLKTLIPQLFEIVNHTRIVIDGIDECPTDTQKLALKDLQRLCLSPASHCKILFSSRREVQIGETLSSKPQITLDARDEVEMDIRLHVKYKMRKLRTSDGILLQKIESILVEKANGIYALSTPPFSS